MVFSRTALTLLRSARTFARTPGLSLALVLTIAFGVGSNAAVYGFVQGLSHPASPYGLSDRLVSIYNQSALHEAGPFSQSEYERLRRRSNTFDWVDVARITPSEVFIRDHTEVVNTAVVGANIAGALNLRLRDGVVVSDRTWQREFGARALSIGDHILVDNVTYPIVGIAPSGLEGLYRDRTVDVWLRSQDRSPQGPDGQHRNLWVVARVQGNLSMSQAQAAAQKSLGTPVEMVTFRDMTPRMAHALSRISILVTLAAAAVFVLACTNVASLLMARASKRSHETSLRVALGASRRELAAELLSDSVTISVAGGAVGTLLATWTAHIVPSFLFKEDAERLVFTPHLAPVVVGALLCVATAIFFGMMPLAATVTDRPWTILRSEGGSPSRAQGNLWSGIIIGQIALCCLVFISTVLLLQNLRQLLEPDGGVGRDNPIVVTGPGVDPGNFKEVERQAGSIADLDALTWAARLPGNAPIWRSFKLLAPSKQLRDVKMNIDWLTPDVVDTLESPPVAGRLFSFGEQPFRVGVVNEEAAAELFGQDTVGTIIKDSAGTQVEIVGVVRRKATGLSKGQRPTIYYDDTGRSNAAARIESATFRAPVASPILHVPLSVNAVSSNYFRVFDLPLIAGRRFPETQGLDHFRVGLINQEAADLFFGEKPLGTDIVDDQGVRTQIIGVVGSRGSWAFRGPADPTVYFPVWQDSVPGMALIMSDLNRNGRLLAELRRRVDAVPGRDPVQATIGTLSAVLNQFALAPLRIVQLIAGTLVFVATMLTVLGLFSSQSYAAFQRRRELSLLIALGAARRNIFLNVIAAGLRLTFAGSLIGTSIGFGLLFILGRDTAVVGLRPLWVWLAGPLLSVILVLLANSIPAYRSSRLDPMTVMHGEQPNRP
jgi:ABC-type antimicrobial peptide transport system permease subunit